MKKSSIEWLIDNLKVAIPEVENYKLLIGLAKDMHKQEVIDASNDSYLNSDLIKRSLKNKNAKSVGEQYYNETYNIKR